MQRAACLVGLRSGSWTSRSPLSTFSQDDDQGEEWERHEALHEDVTGQERTSERLFEEEIELKWEKGGSGLVFYTDAQFWQEEEGGNACTRQGQGWSLLFSLRALCSTQWVPWWSTRLEG